MLHSVHVLNRKMEDLGKKYYSHAFFVCFLGLEFFNLTTVGLSAFSFSGELFRKRNFFFNKAASTFTF